MNTAPLDPRVRDLGFGFQSAYGDRDGFGQRSRTAVYDKQRGGWVEPSKPDKGGAPIKPAKPPMVVRPPVVNRPVPERVRPAPPPPPPMSFVIPSPPVEPPGLGQGESPSRVVVRTPTGVLGGLPTQTTLAIPRAERPVSRSPVDPRAYKDMVEEVRKIAEEARCKPRPEKNEPKANPRRGAGGERVFIPWCK